MRFFSFLRFLLELPSWREQEQARFERLLVEVRRQP